MENQSATRGRVGLALRPRFEIVGEWSGPKNPAGNYTRFVYREISRDRKFVEWCDGKAIIYTDGTALYLRTRQLAKGEREGVKKRGYSDLVRDCYRQNVTTVAALVEKQNGGAS